MDNPAAIIDTILRADSALIVVLLIVIWKMDKKLERLEDKKDDLIRRYNEAMKAITDELKNEQNFKREIYQAINLVANKIEGFTR